MVIFQKKQAVRPTSIQKALMSDSDKERPENSSTKPAEAEDESIIDLVDEIEDQSAPDALPALDPQLISIAEALDAQRLPSTPLPDLEQLDFEEEEEQPERERLPGEAAILETDAPSLNESMDWLLDPVAEDSSDGRDKPPAAASAAPLEKIAFDEPSPETKQILEEMSPPFTAADAGDGDDDIELIEIEEDEPDNGLLWLDDLDLDKIPAATKRPVDGLPLASPLSDTDADLFPETTAADVFAANMASGEMVSDRASAAAPSPAEGLIPAVAALATPVAAAAALPSSAELPIAEAASLSAEQIEAAVERLIERKLGGTLESIVVRAVETAVAKEIQRLKLLLLEYDPDDRIS
jgi:hypothetical protein